ncbi:MAG: YdcF family protein [Thermodesulfobacteriota bacterium]
MKKILKYFFITIFIFFLFWLFLLGGIYSTSFIDETRKVDAIVVLGASQWNGKPSPVLKSRLNHALKIYNEGYADYIILTGGIAEGDVKSESRVGKEYLRKNGVAENKILIEEKGLTTSESLKKAAGIIREKKFEKILVVSHGYHILRIKKIAKDLKIENVYASPVKVKNSWKKLRFMLRESIILPVYIINPNYGSKYKNFEV